MRGRFRPGQRLTEEVLGELYAVSRVPVREALRVLEVEGFVTIAPYKGVRVSIITAADADDLFTVRETVERLTARRAAGNCSPTDLAVLEDLLQRGAAAERAGDISEDARLNTLLHQHIASMSGNSSLQRMLAQLSAKLEWLYTVDVRHRANSWQEHREIVAAIAAGDALRADGLMRAHVLLSRASYLYTSGVRIDPSLDPSLDPPTDHSSGARGTGAGEHATDITIGAGAIPTAAEARHA